MEKRILNFNSYHQKANNEFCENLREMDDAGVLIAADKGLYPRWCIIFRGWAGLIDH